MGTNRVAVARHGLTYQDVNRHCLVEVSGDVLHIKREILERWPGLIDVWWDKDRMKFVITRKWNGSEDLLMERDTLNEFTIQEIARAENISAEELIRNIDKANEEREKEIDHEFSEKIGDAGERLLHALRKDGIVDHPDIYGVRNKPGLRRRSAHRR